MTVVYACVVPFVRVEGRCVKGDSESMVTTRDMDLFLCHIRTVVHYRYANECIEIGIF